MAVRQWHFLLDVLRRRRRLGRRRLRLLFLSSPS